LAHHIPALFLCFTDNLFQRPLFFPEDFYDVLFHLHGEGSLSFEVFFPFIGQPFCMCGTGLPLRGLIAFDFTANDRFIFLQDPRNFFLRDTILP
jgi:hypothetical protein